MSLRIESHLIEQDVEVELFNDSCYLEGMGCTDHYFYNSLNEESKLAIQVFEMQLQRLFTQAKQLSEILSHNN